MDVVGNLIGPIRQLGFQPRLPPLEKVPAQVPQRPGALGRAMLQDSLARLEGQVQPAECRVPVLQTIHHAQRLEIVLEASERLHALIERILSRVTERRVTEIVGEADRLGQVFIESHGSRHRPGNLRHLERMGQPGSVMVALVIDEHLCLVEETPKRRGMDDPVPVPLELGAMAR